MLLLSLLMSGGCELPLDESSKQDNGLAPSADNGLQVPLASMPPERVQDSKPLDLTFRPETIDGFDQALLPDTKITRLPELFLPSKKKQTDVSGTLYFEEGDIEPLNKINGVQLDLKIPIE